MKEDLHDEVKSELICVLDSAEEIVEIIKRVLRDYNLQRDPELDNELFNELINHIKAMEHCANKAKELFNELQGERYGE
jgi:uncharacterized protein YpbB